MTNGDQSLMHRSRVLTHLDQFRVYDVDVTSTGLMRSMLDMFLLWQVVQYFKPRSFLEIGFAAGQTMGIMYEASHESASYVSVDKDYRHQWIFDQIFADHSVVFNNIDSRHIEFDQHQTFDFIHIDGEHSYEMACNDLNKVRPLLHEQTILYMDDYLTPDVDLAIRHEILAKSDWRPFLCGDQGMFFHHMRQSKDRFVDHDLQQKSRNFVYYLNEEMYDTLVLRARMPNVFVDHPQIFIDTLCAYDL